MFYVYILQSIKTRRYYIGEAESVQVRLRCHNNGRVLVTKHGRPWELIYTEMFATRSEARIRERQIKNYKGGVQFRALLNGTIRKR
ncbi:MAG: GIY-YIG nuclease family protein [bacterium]